MEDIFHSDKNENNRIIRKGGETAAEQPPEATTATASATAATASF